jgi:uncharacterized membrane protein (UPF0127 family)
MPFLFRLIPIRFLAALVLALAVVSGHAAHAAAQADVQNPPGPTEPLTIITASGSHKFAVEVMRKRAELEKGLMFRRSMPADHGMLFDFKKSQPVMMWMRNTYIPLDMVFIASSGTVVSIAANAQPLSDNIIHSGGAVLGVLELNAGTAARIGLKPGDKVVFPLFAK